MKSPPLARFKNADIYRIIPSRYPPIDLYRGVAPAEDWEFLQKVAMRTNHRLNEQEFPTGLIRPEDRIAASSSSYIMGPLSRPNPNGSRFADNSFGIVYAGLDFETAQAEVIAQREAFLRATHQRPQRIDVRVVVMTLSGDLHDLTNEDAEVLADPQMTARIGRQLRDAGSYGVLFNSLARPQGLCIGVFRPAVLSNCRQERHFAYVWDGTAISEVSEYSQRELPTSRDGTRIFCGESQVPSVPGKKK